MSSLTAHVMAAALHSTNSSVRRVPSLPLGARAATVPEDLCVSFCCQEISLLSWEAAACMQDREAQHYSITDHFKQPYHAMAAKIKQKKAFQIKHFKKRCQLIGKEKLFCFGYLLKRCHIFQNGSQLWNIFIKLVFALVTKLYFIAMCYMHTEQTKLLHVK